MSKKKNRYLRKIDWSIFLILLGLAFFSYMGISGASPRFGEETKQLIWYGIGFVILIIMLLFNYKFLGTVSYVLYGLGIILLIGVLFVEESNNVNRAYDLKHVAIQPSEFMKLFLILALARWFAKTREKGNELRAFYQLWPVFLLFIPPIVLIILQPDLGTSLVFIGAFAVMLLVAGVRFRHLFYLGLMGVGGIASLVYIYMNKNELFFKIIKEYQWRRLTSFIDPENDPTGTGYQLKQSLLAVGSGTLQGKGIDEQTLASNKWLPAGETDFVFAVIAERFGFLGSAALLFLFFMLIYRMIRIAITTDDLFGSLVVAGIVGMFVFQIFENIGMAIGIMPITGIPLPFISYGGSSLVTNIVAVGLVLNIGMRRRDRS